MHYLPTELMAQILSYLDPQSLMRAELVSRSWREAASSHHVWRNVFRREFGRRQHSGTTTKRKKQSAGLGKTLPNQDWKRMFMVRQALERRWKEGKAAAIYLHGHTDSVYCVQFDEYVSFSFHDARKCRPNFIPGTRSSRDLVTGPSGSGMLITPGRVSKSSVHPQGT